MKKLLAFTLLLLTILGSLEVKAQDPQFSQFYAAPLYLNPGFAGTTPYIRGGLNFRSQWPALDAQFTTYSAYVDHFLEQYSSGIGLLITTDREGLANLNSTSVAGQYAYQLNLSEKLTFRPGIQVGYTIRSINFDKLTFGDQFDETGFISPTSAEQFNTGENIGFIDFSFGGLLFSKNFWLGFASHHLNTPNQSFVDGNSELPVKLSVHSGYRLPLSAGPGRKGFNKEGKERSVTPNFQYKKQGKFDQLDIGSYLTLEPLVFGLWYRGIPIQQDFEDFDKESIILLVGLTTDKLNIGYSFDYTISQLGIASGGAHEISISYQFPPDPRKPPRNVRQIPCPRF